MFRPNTVSARNIRFCNHGSAETSVSAIVEFGQSVPKHPFLQSCAETSCAETSILTWVLSIILELFVLLAYFSEDLSLLAAAAGIYNTYIHGRY